MESTFYSSGLAYTQLCLRPHKDFSVTHFKKKLMLNKQVIDWRQKIGKVQLMYNTIMIPNATHMVKTIYSSQNGGKNPIEYI